MKCFRDMTVPGSPANFVSTRIGQASTKSTPSMEVSTSIRTGGTPIWKTVPALERSSSVRSCSAAPKARNASITFLAFSGAGRIQMSRSFVPEKWERATVLNLALMSLLVRGSERIALLDRPDRPASGRATLNRIASIVTERQTRENDDGIPPTPELPRYGSVVLIGDFLAPPETILQAARTLAARGLRGFMLQVLDPAEVEMPFQGRRRFLGMEDEGDLLVSRAEGLRLGYLKRLAELQDELSTFARRTDWYFAVHNTDGPAQPALLGLYTAIADHLDL